MKNLAIICLTATFLLAGCEPEELVVWNWNAGGSHAVVMTADKTFVTDTQGKISLLADVPTRTGGWLPDGKSVLLAERREFTTWADLKKVLDEQQIEEIEKHAHLLRQVLPAADDPKALSPLVEALEPGLAPAVVLALRDSADEPLKKKLGEAWKDVRDMQVAASFLTIREVGASQDKPTVTVAVVLKDIVDLRISPDGKHALLTTLLGEKDGQLCRLWVIDLKPGSWPVEVASSVGAYADWQADSKSVVYLAKTDNLGVLASQNVTSEMPEKPEPLAITLFGTNAEIRCLTDGRILFTAAPVSLPAAGQAQLKSTLFQYDPADRSVRRVISPDAEEKLPGGVALFNVSLDGKHIVVAGSNGSVAVVELATGKHRQIVEGGENSSLVSVPSWRTSDSLSVVIPAGGRIAGQKAQPATRPSVALVNVTDGTAKVISESWPQAVIDGIAKRANAEAQTQPATQPTTGPATQLAQP